MNRALALFALVGGCGFLESAETPPPVAVDATPVATAPAPAPDAPAPPAPSAAAPAPVTPQTAFSLDAAAVRVARNEVFARHGRAFSSDDLRAHFEAQDWYTVDPDYSDDRLSDAERAQVAMLASFETDRDPVSTGQFRGELDLFFADADHVLIGDGMDSLYEMEGMYEAQGEAMSYAVRGDWVLMWPSGADRGQSTAGTLVRLDYSAGTVAEVHSVNPSLL